MQIDAETGLLSEASWCESPNQDARPDVHDIDLVVIHGISLPPGEYGGPAIEALFTNCLDPHTHPYFATVAHLRLSAHLLIRRDGSLVQFVPFHCRAWHAGESCYAQRVNCNDFSIGIELEGVDDCPYADIQYIALARVVGALLNTYPRLDAQRIVGHCDIAPQRKTDPGPAFDWCKLRTLLECQ
ncbi:MAG: 1,6-anhydro-N-acetylmuramyl-L-alanine amidase AmpD [Gammaproteobacteria bacterium]|nr:1,6-anhydro-N-acetylmuramyl-L-alanine amidase AmpD [Gammaproteobacteria bacterium]